ncbi:unnamed protein product, partial [Medioppia subpectinata]
ESAQGLVLGAYFYGYTVTQFCGSYADKFGAKWMTGLGVFMPALFNALIPIAAGVHYSLVIVLRALIGAFHGVVYSCLFSMFNKWFPQSEKRWAISGTIFLGNFGGVIAMPLTGYLCESHLLDGWPNVYYLTSLAHILWFVLWHLLVSNTPEEDNNISDAELQYITQNNPQSKSVKNLSIPWKAIFTSRPVWGSIVTKMCGQFGYFVLCTKMPAYIDQVFGLTIQSNSWFNSMMYGCLCVTNISAGPLSNWVRNKGWFSNTRNCKNFQSLALSLVLIPIVGCNSGAVIALMLLSMLSYGTVTGGEYGVIPDYALNYSGTIFGVANTLASTPGFIGPLIIGLLLDHGDGSNVRNQWNILWYMSAAIYVLGGLAFELLGSAEPQHWAIGTYIWSESIQGVILGSYFYGYTVTQLLGSYADRLGAKWMAGLGVFVPAICNALIPVLADIHYSLVILMRLLDGWPNVYYLTSLAHILWFVLWHLLVSNTPEEDNNISDAELLYITQNNPQSKSVKNLSIPWREIFTSRPVWGSIVTKMCGQFGYFVLCTKMPTYIDQVFGLSIQSNSWFNSMMYGCLCVTNISAGPLSNWVRNKGWFSNTRNCKNFQSLAVSLVLIPIVGCNSGAVIALMLLSMLSYGTVTGGEYGVIPDYALNYSGTIFGVANTLASTPGFIGPLIIGLLLDHGDGSNVRNQWNILWYMSAGIYVLGGLAFELLGSAEPQHWAIVTDNTKPNPSPDIMVGVLGSIGCTLVYLLRSNLSVAIIAMVDERTIQADRDDMQTDDLCYDSSTYNKTGGHEYKGTYIWSESIQGVILGSYFYGYTVTQLLGSYADRLGAKWMAGLGVFVPAICNALIPVLADIHYSLVILMRVLIGAFHGVVYSSLFSMFAKWFPQSEKNMALTGTTFAGNLGGVITMPLAGYLIKTDWLDGWPVVFYLTSFVHLIWFAFWCYFVSNSPDEDPKITERELKYIVSNNPNSRKVKNLKIPWRAVFTSRVVWASAVAKSTGSFGYYLLCTKMPQYLDSIFGMAIHTNSWFNALMYVVICTALLSGSPLSAWVKRKGWFTQTRNRKNFQSLAMFGCGLCLLLVPIVGCDGDAVIALLLISMFVYGFISGGEYGVIAEYAPDYSGTVFGVANTLASATGFAGPLIVGVLLDHGDGSGVRHQWNIVWYLSAAIYIFGGIFYEVFGSAEPQPWAVVDERDYQMERKITFISDYYTI